MRRADGRGCAARILILIAAAALPFAAHPAIVLAALFLLPVLSECMRAAGWKGHGVMTAAAVCLGAWLAGETRVGQLVGLWLLAALTVERLPALRTHRRRTLGWTLFYAAMVCICMTLLRERYHGTAAAGLADDITALVQGLESPERTLLTAYQLGLARLEGEMAEVPAIQLFGAIIMAPDTKQELINSLRTTLHYLLNDLLTDCAAGYLTVSTLLCAVLPEAIRRRRGEPTELKSIDALCMSRREALCAGSLLLFGMVQYLTDSLAVYQAAGMAMTAFSILCGAQGVCLIAWWLRKSRSRMGIIPGTIIVLLMLPAAGFILLMLGAVDQIADPRKLRGTDIEGGK